MEDSGAHILINHLLQGRDLARHLQMSLNSPSTSPETPDMLIRRIIATFEKALSLLNCSATHPAADSPPLTPRTHDSPRSSSARWTKQIRISPGVAVESLLDDGFSWRKYGQKDILGAKFPRGYYRCTHRHAQGCLATKQVQRSDEDPAVMEVNYRGNHTCKVAPGPNPAPPSQEQLVNLRAGLRVLTENLNASDQTSFAPSLLPATSNVNPDNRDSMGPAVENNNVVETLSSAPYMSPATSATAHFPVSPRGIAGFGGPLNLPASTPGINDGISPASAPEFPFDHFEFEGHAFTFHNPRYF